jgi:dynein heavy chain
LDNATELIDGLAGEKISWGQKAIINKDASKAVTGDSLIAAGFIAYMGAFLKVYRDECL